jgi:hypothetical protein
VKVWSFIDHHTRLAGLGDIKRLLFFFRHCRYCGWELE